MSAFNGTPGPWLRIDTADYAEIHSAFRPSSQAVALVGKPDDANLIAAAPDLLEELSKFAAKANGYDGVPPPKYFGDIDCELRYPDSLKIEFTLGELRAARKAIAAATGEGL